MGLISQISLPAALAAALAASLLYAAALAAYRVFAHPLRRIPGPWLAAATYWYESYYILWKKGKYTYRYDRLHEKYGPLLRINPDEVHVKDPDYYESIYYVGTPFEKSHFCYDGMESTNMFTITSNEDAKRHREPMSHFFSRRSVLQLEYLVRAEVERLCARLQTVAETGGVLDMHSAVRAVAFDIVTELSFEFSYGAIDREDLGVPFMEQVEGAVWVWMMNAYFFGRPMMSKLMGLLPSALVPKDAGYITSWFSTAYGRVQAVAQMSPEELVKSAVARPSIFKTLLSPETKKKLDLPLDYLANEAFILLTAGGETVGSAMNKAIFGVLYSPDVHKKVAAELKEAFPSLSDEMSFLKLEQLPYLSAVIKEGLRMSDGVSNRLPRVVPPQGAYYKDTFIPGGMRISMSHYCMHNDPRIFPEPEKCRPERWLENPALEKYLVAFSRGTRICIGKNLAMEEMYLTLGALFRRFDMELYDVGPEDMVFEHVYFSGLHGKNQRHVKVRAKPRAD